jgi:hypothetical protein
VGEKVAEISCGHQHSICKTATSKVFTWGLGSSGQLGLGTRKGVNLPTHVKGKDQNISYKARSVQATYCSSYILYETRKVFHAGSEASSNTENIYFKQLDYEPKVGAADTGVRRAAAGRVCSDAPIRQVEQRHLSGVSRSGRLQRCESEQEHARQDRPAGAPEVGRHLHPE